jgi:hypothetical protein
LDEKDQPEIVGWSVNYQTGKLENGEDALYCDWYVRKEHADVIRRYPTRSVEYYVNRQTIWPVALLKSSCPELSLPILKYKYRKELQPGEEPPVQFECTEQIKFSISPPTTESNPMFDEKTPMDDPKVDEKKESPKKDAPKSDEDKAKADAQKAEEKGAKTDQSELTEIKQMLAQLMPILPDLMQLVSLMKEEAPVGDDEDLMKPADSVPEKDKAFDNPVKFDAAMGSATNCNVPGFTKEKESYMSNDEKLKYRKEVESEVAAKYKAELDAVKKVADDLNKKSRRQEAEKLVYSMENDHNIAMTAEVKAEEIDTLAALDPKSAEIYFKRAVVRYQKRLPDSKGVQEVAKYAVEGDPQVAAATPEETYTRIQAILQSGLSPAEYYKRLAEGKAK